MPVAYAGTITFDSNMNLDKKLKRIDEFPKILATHLRYSKNDDTRYYLSVAKEYHKVGQEDDFEAPHLHFILYTEKPLQTYRVNAINKMFKDTCGRSQFFRMTDLKRRQYETYIQKDSERLFKLTGQHHYYEMNLEQPLEDYDLENEMIDDEFDYI